MTDISLLVSSNVATSIVKRQFNTRASVNELKKLFKCKIQTLYNLFSEQTMIVKTFVYNSL